MDPKVVIVFTLLHSLAESATQLEDFGKPSLKKSHKTADLFRTSLSPPLPPRIYGHYGFFLLLKARTDDSRHLAKKARMLPFLGEPILFIRNSKILVLGDHFWGVNSYFCANFIIKIASVILGKTPPKAMEWG